MVDRRLPSQDGTREFDIPSTRYLCCKLKMKLFDIIVFGALAAPILGLPTDTSSTKRVIIDPYRDCQTKPINPVCIQAIPRGVDAAVTAEVCSANFQKVRP